MSGIRSQIARRQSGSPRSGPNVGLLGYGLDRPLSGIGRYTVELARELVASERSYPITLLKPFSGSAAGLDALLQTKRIHARRLPSLMITGPSQIMIAARKLGLTVVHDPFGVSPFLVPRRVAPFGRIVTIHDAVPFVYPETHTRLTNVLFRYYIPRTIRFVDHIITDSIASKRDLMRFYHVPDEKVSVIYCGVSQVFTPASPVRVAEVCRHYGIPQPYLLTVGALQARKNLETLFEVYKVLRDRGVSHHLVVVGRKAWKTEGIFRRLNELGLQDSVTLTGYIADVDLPVIYSGASVFVFPSLYEGFGLPPLEAMACGTPVVTSDSSSLPEVVGDAGITVSPRNISDYVAVLEQLLDDPLLRDEYRARGLKRAQLFSWRRAAEEHVAVYARWSRQ